VIPLQKQGVSVSKWLEERIAGEKMEDLQRRRQVIDVLEAMYFHHLRSWETYKDWCAKKDSEATLAARRSRELQIRDAGQELVQLANRLERNEASFNEWTRRKTEMLKTRLKANELQATTHLDQMHMQEQEAHARRERAYAKWISGKNLQRRSERKTITDAENARRHAAEMAKTKSTQKMSEWTKAVDTKKRRMRQVEETKKVNDQKQQETKRRQSEDHVSRWLAKKTLERRRSIPAAGKQEASKRR